MSTIFETADEAMALLEAMDVLFSEAKVAVERRGELRVPFLRPVTVDLADDGSQPVAALSRDLSPTGIGLVHSERLEPGPAIVTVPTTRGESFRFRAKIRWVLPLGDDWYISGAQIMQVIS